MINDIIEQPLPFDHWEKEQEITAIKNGLKGNKCSNCRKQLGCPVKTSLKGKFICCYLFEALDVNDFFRIIRQGFPNSVKDQMFQEFQMDSPEDEIFYIKPTFGDKDD